MKRFLALILALSLLLTACGGGEEKWNANALAEQTAALLLEKNPEPIPGPLGGEWLVLGMCRLGYDLPEGWIDGYRQKLERYVTDCGGILHDRKYTEYSRVILTVTAMGGDARNVAGYDLTAPLEDYEQTIFQGVNGAIYALLALDSGNYGSEAIRDRYIAHILEKELPDGGWCMMGDVPEADVTAMALQALAKYRDREDVKPAVERGLKVLEAAEYTTSEAVSQTIVALCELGMPADEKVKLLLTYQTEAGDFRHVMDGDADALSTEQAFYALVSASLQLSGKSLYRMAANTCTLEIRCDTLLKNLDKLSSGKAELVPEDGILLEKTTVSFESGDSVFDVLRRCLREQNVHFEYVDAKAYGSIYIEGIGNLYEFDCGEQSGWLYFVNGISPGLGCSGYTVANGDEIVFAYTCDMGADLGVEKTNE
ncbi:MAG: DUF4430 domain-containing protein [Oscillospiraceae bacterium]|nr:DUF4430 domain-containing protein [Oscillospiraceae bacterium]